MQLPIQHHKALIGVLIAFRLTLTLASSDGTIKSDGITYTGIVVNLLERGNLSAVLPLHESAVSAGQSFTELYRSLRNSPSSVERLVPFQWLHALVYAPFLWFFPHLATILILNVVFLCITGTILMRNASPLAQQLGWAILLFFPPFIQLTENFLSEPTFFAILSLFFMLIGSERTRPITIGMLGALLCITRPLGLAVCFLTALYELRRRKMIRSVSLVTAILASATLNAFLLHPSSSRVAVLHTPGVTEALYLSNTPMSNGDLDAYYVETNRGAADQSYLKFLHDDNGSELVAALAGQVIGRPEKWLALTAHKTIHMLFGIVPDNWIYSPAKEQGFIKKVLWFLGTCTLWVLILLGWRKKRSQGRLLYFLFGLLTFVLHLLLAARFRYMTPVLVLGIPYAADFAESILKGMVGRRSEQR